MLEEHFASVPFAPGHQVKEDSREYFFLEIVE
jgi:hypothetical protein